MAAKRLDVGDAKYIDRWETPVPYGANPREHSKTDDHGQAEEHHCVQPYPNLSISDGHKKTNKIKGKSDNTWA